MRKRCIESIRKAQIEMKRLGYPLYDKSWNPDHLSELFTIGNELAYITGRMKFYKHTSPLYTELIKLSDSLIDYTGPWTT